MPPFLLAGSASLRYKGHVVERPQPKRRCRADVITGRTHRVQHVVHSHHEEEAVMMRRNLVVALTLLVAVAIMAPVVNAQAPPPAIKTTITGLIDTVTSYTRNASNIDGVLNRDDQQWYARNRGRFDIIGEVGQVKGVFGFEIDAVWGQAGSNDSTIANSGAAATTAVTTQPGTSGSFDLNTDVRAIVEVKWLRSEQRRVGKECR